MRTVEQERAVWSYLEKNVSGADREARHTGMLCHVMPDFYERYRAPDIPVVLDQWRLADRIRQSPDEPVVITAEGVKR